MKYLYIQEIYRYRLQGSKFQYEIKFKLKNGRKNKCNLRVQSAVTRCLQCTIMLENFAGVQILCLYVTHLPEVKFYKSH